MQNSSLSMNRGISRKQRVLRGWRFLLACLVLGGWVMSSSAQITLNIKDYGAKGDAVQFYVNTVSNSIVVTTTNQCSSADIGKYIEIFGVGKSTYGVNSYGMTTNGNQDLIGVVTNVVAGTNLYLNVVQLSGSTTNFLPQVTGTAWATMGTDNTPIINDVIQNKAAGYTNATIYIPNGIYLCLTRLTPKGSKSYSCVAIPVHRGGLHLVGESESGTVLLSRGAWQSWGNGTYPVRGFLFEIVAPITNDYPLIFENMTWDGGVQQGDLPVHGIQCNPVDGLGWDQQHSAYLTFDSGNNTGTASFQVLTNIAVVHWRGESIKSIDGNTNGAIDIEHCFFGDICATALNVYPRWNIRDNVFSNCWQITEYYQQFYRGTAYFCNNFITNDPALGAKGYIGNMISINGGMAAASPLIIESNTIYNGVVGRNIFITTPAANVSFLNNEIHSGSYGIVFNIGPQGSQGTDCNTNLLIAGNSVYTAGDKLTAFVELGGVGLQYVDGLVITNNYISAPVQVQNALLSYGGAYTNVVFEHNIFDSPETGFSLKNTQCPLVLINENNVYNPIHIYYTTVGTNTLLLSKGPRQLVGQGSEGQVLCLQDSSTNIIPTGAWMEVDNRQNLSIKYNDAKMLVYPSEKMMPGTGIVLPYGAMLKFYWNGNTWTTNMVDDGASARPIPPSSLRILN